MCPFLLAAFSTFAEIEGEFILFKCLESIHLELLSKANKNAHQFFKCYKLYQ